MITFNNENDEPFSAGCTFRSIKAQLRGKSSLTKSDTVTAFRVDARAGGLPPGLGARDLGVVGVLAFGPASNEDGCCFLCTWGEASYGRWSPA
jgi:hypothetical protein